MTCVVEKAPLKDTGRSNSAACVKNITRAMVVVDSMDEVATVMEVLCVLHNEELSRIEIHS